MASCPIDKFGAAQIAQFGAHRRHAVDLARGRTSKTCPARRTETGRTWRSPIGSAGLPVTVPAAGGIPRWMTMPPVGECRGPQCSGADDHRHAKEPNRSDPQITGRFQGNLILQRHCRESDLWPLWFPCACLRAGEHSAGSRLVWDASRRSKECPTQPGDCDRPSLRPNCSKELK